MRNRRSQFDMAHTLTAHARQRNFNAALLAGNAAIFDALILTTRTLIVLLRTKNARTEQAVALGLEGTIVDGFRLFDLAVRPGPDFFRAGDRDTQSLKRRGWCVRVVQVGDFLAHIIRSLAVIRETDTSDWSASLNQINQANTRVSTTLRLSHYRSSQC